MFLKVFPKKVEGLNQSYFIPVFTIFTIQFNEIIRNRGVFR